MFGLPRDVCRGARGGATTSNRCCRPTRSSPRGSRASCRAWPAVADAAAAVAGHAGTNGDAHPRRRLSPDAVRASLDRAAEASGFRPGSFQPFSDRLPRLLDATDRLTYEGYEANGLGDLARRFVVRDGARWLTATLCLSDRSGAGRIARAAGRPRGPVSDARPDCRSSTASWAGDSCRSS